MFSSLCLGKSHMLVLRRSCAYAVNLRVRDLRVNSENLAQNFQIYVNSKAEDRSVL